MKVKKLIKELNKFHPDAEVELLSCHNKNCPQLKDKVCDCKNCHFIAYGINYITKITKNPKDEINNKHDWPCIGIEIYDSWDYDTNCELISQK